MLTKYDPMCTPAHRKAGRCVNAYFKEQFFCYKTCIPRFQIEIQLIPAEWVAFVSRNQETLLKRFFKNKTLDNLVKATVSAAKTQR